MRWSSPSVAPQASQKTGEVGFVPVVLYVRYESRNQNQIDRPVAKRLEGNVNIAAPGVARHRLHDRFVLTRRDFPRLNFRNTREL